MKRQEVEEIITEYLKPIFGFALKRCKSIQDAEDLSQEIVLKAFRALLAKDDVADMGKFIWTVAHNTLSNYYRDSTKNTIGLSIDEMSDYISAFDLENDIEATRESVNRLQSEIAFLSKLQRRIIIAYYFENRKQADIAKELDIPLGTVKWHLFEAKKELKRGMDTMRKTSELKFNPIKFEDYGISGSIGSRTLDSFFGTRLVQNICYCIKDTAKTVNEIAEDLGVSPVYIEELIEMLDEYSYLTKDKDKYIANFIIDEPTTELLTIQDKMYKEAANVFANDLFDDLVGSGLLDDQRIICGQTDEPITLSESKRANHNFLLWTLIPYIISPPNETERILVDANIKFEDVATLRPDGSYNIFYATVLSQPLSLPTDFVERKNLCGPAFQCNDFYNLWRLDTEWSEKRIKVNKADFDDAMKVLYLFAKEDEAELDKDEYTWLAERGFVKTNGDYDGYFKSSWQVVILTDTSICKELCDIGNKVKKKYAQKFEELKKPFAELFIASAPKHLRKIQEYQLQGLFYSDGWFLIHCIKALINSGKLKEPTENQKKCISTLIAPNK